MNFEYNTKLVKVYLDSIEYHMMFKKKLSESKVEFYTHALPSEKCKHIVLKGLPNIEIKSIMECLKLKNQEPLRCVLMKQKKPEPYNNPMFLITFDSAKDIREVRKIMYVCSVKVRWDTYKNKRRVTQCFNCQELDMAQEDVVRHQDALSVLIHI